MNNDREVAAVCEPAEQSAEKRDRLSDLPLLSATFSAVV
jgi:hypothetical protein